MQKRAFTQEVEAALDHHQHLGLYGQTTRASKLRSQCADLLARILTSKEVQTEKGKELIR